MKKAFFLFICISTLSSYTAMAQNNPVIKKAIKSPTAKEDAARADALLMNNKLVYRDSTTTAPPEKVKKSGWFRKKAKTPKS